MSDLSSLIARLEKAEGPDRELDAEIVFDMFATPVGKHKEDDGPIGYIRLDDQPSWNLGLRFPGKDRSWFAATRKQIKGETLLIERDGAFVLMNSLRIPELTASIDAAVSLAERVLPGWMRSMTTGLGHTAAYVRDKSILDPSKIEGEGYHATPAIALVLATLRALRQKGSSNG